MHVRLTGRRDGLLLAGLAVALITVFDRTISRLLEIASAVESSYGVRLLPALVVLGAIFVLNLHAKRQESKLEAAAAALTARIAEERLAELERLHAFGRQLAGALSLEAIQGAIWRHLPALAGERDTWLVVWNRERTEVLLDSASGPADRLDETARKLLEAWRAGESTDTLRRVPGDCCFVLVAGGHAIGVLGVSERGGDVPPSVERMVAAATALVAVSIRNVQLFQELRETAFTDALTGCVNRTRFMDAMGAELRRTRRTGSPLALLMLDLDGFKQINDEDGHLAGDAALAVVGRRLKELLRVSDVRCRYGGDEFLVLLPDTPLKGALHVAEVLRREIEELAIRAKGSGQVVTASVGVAPASPGEIDPVYCIQRADRALYAAKHQGRNRVAAAEPETTSDRLARSA
jgi:diguanylate cyclase (GGDEF)-like protein